MCLAYFLHMYLSSIELFFFFPAFRDCMRDTLIELRSGLELGLGSILCIMFCLGHLGGGLESVFASMLGTSGHKSFYAFTGMINSLTVFI